MSSGNGTALAGESLLNLEVITRLGEHGREQMNHYRPRSEAHTLCGATCDDDGAFGEWLPRPDDHPEDACGLPGNVCSTCDAIYRKGARIARGGPARKRDDRPAWKRSNGLPKVRHVAVPKAAPAPVAAVSDDLLRLYRAELEALGTAEAKAELERRRVKRAAKRAARKVAA